MGERMEAERLAEIKSEIDKLFDQWCQVERQYRGIIDEILQALIAEREAFESSQRIQQTLHNQIEELDAELRAALTGWDKSNDHVKAVKAEIQDGRDAWAPETLEARS